jgi:hypothetical protein
MDTKDTTWLEEKYSMLIDSISSDNNTSGLRGCFIKAGEFQQIYKKKYPRHFDYRGFSWNSYIKNKARDGVIKVYLKHPKGKNHYYILNNQLEKFLSIYPDGIDAI